MQRAEEVDFITKIAMLEARSFDQTAITRGSAALVAGLATPFFFLADELSYLASAGAMVIGAAVLVSTATTWFSDAGEFLDWQRLVATVTMGAIGFTLSAVMLGLRLYVDGYVPEL